MDKSLEYRKMCYNAKEIQESWKINEGDTIVLKASYCTDRVCEEYAICDECLRMNNEFVIAGNHYDKYYLFSPTLCVRGDGCRINSTSASILVKDKELINDIQSYNTHIDKVFWLPRQDQLQTFIHNNQNWSIHDILEEFTFYVGLIDLDTYEKYWISFVMDVVFDKEWNGYGWI